ncbi:MAG: hypothetical protein ACOC5T_01360 [Elusimicrobiota bacterium]
MEESDIPQRIGKYSIYRLENVPIDKIKDIDSVDYAPVIIDPGKVDDYEDMIRKTHVYPPVVLNDMGYIIDRYHRLFALKNIGCNKVWAYVPHEYNPQ